MGSPGVLRDGPAASVPRQSVPERRVPHQAKDGVGQGVGVGRRDQPGRLAVVQHLSDLLEVAGHDGPTHGHILEELGGRPEER